MILFTGYSANQTVCEVSHLEFDPRHVVEVGQLDVNDVVFHEEFIVTMLCFEVLDKGKQTVFSYEALLVIVDEFEEFIGFAHINLSHLKAFVAVVFGEKGGHVASS